MKSLVAALVLTFASVAWAQEQPIAPPVKTQHAGRFNGEEVRYTAIVGETILRGPDGKPAATIFSTSYVRDGADPKTRPVVFAFNGGPGASSSPLHMSAFGPKRSSRSSDAPKPGTPTSSAAPEAEPTLADNAYSLLSDADLVFIDPVGAGYTRVFPGADASPFWDVQGDAKAILGFIQAWLHDNGRTASPRFICGESYGGARLGAILGQMGEFRLDGALFISPVLDWALSSGDQSFVFLVPSMAVTAAYHGRGEGKGRSAAQVYDAAVRFAQNEYLVALQKGVRLPAAERARIAKRLSALLGLPESFVLDKNLRISREDFVSTLLADKGLRVGQLDGRYSGNAAELATRQPPYNDPGLAGSGGASGKILPDWLTQDLKFDAEGRRYVGLSMDVNRAWNWGAAMGAKAYPSALASIGKAMQADPALKIYLGGGLYDMTTPALAGRYAIDHAGVPLDRITVVDFEAGHSMYAHEPSLKKMSESIRAFLRARGNG
jgi:carboxypeptidase C (cathepsin A)